MDFGGRVLLIVVAIGLVLLFFFRRGRRFWAREREIVAELLSEVRLNQALIGIFLLRAKPKKFEVVSWKRNNARLGFLTQSLQNILAQSFIMIEDFNHQIDVIKKSKSTDQSLSLDVEKLKESLAKSRQGLEQWLMVNTGSKKPPGEYPSIFDSLFGRRG